ncbi:MAG: hypothetical protein ACYDBY_14690 [Thermoanaerobaculia bacterium]
MKTASASRRLALVAAVAALVAILTPAEASAAGPFSFYPITPCRVVDTRSGLGGYNTVMPNGAVRTFTIKSASPCFVPSTAKAVAFNVTVADPANQGFVALWPYGQAYPNVSTINFVGGENLANGAIVPVTTGTPDLNVVAAFEPGASGVNLILDITGYFQ